MEMVLVQDNLRNSVSQYGLRFEHLDKFSYKLKSKMVVTELDSPIVAIFLKELFESFELKLISDLADTVGVRLHDTLQIVVEVWRFISCR